MVYQNTDREGTLLRTWSLHSDWQLARAAKCPARGPSPTVHIKTLNVVLLNVKMKLIMAPVNFSNERPHLVKWTASDGSLEIRTQWTSIRWRENRYLIVNLRGLRITHPLALKRKCQNLFAESGWLKAAGSFTGKVVNEWLKKKKLHVKLTVTITSLLFSSGKMPPR